MHVDYMGQSEEEQTQSDKTGISKCQSDTLNGTLTLTLEELAM